MITYQRILGSSVVFLVLVGNLALSVVGTYDMQRSSDIPRDIFYNQCTEDKIQAAIVLVNETLLEHVLTTLVGYAPRYSGTYGCQKSAEYLYDCFTGMNVDTHVHEWGAFGNQYNRQMYNSQNIEAVIPGCDTSRDGVVTFTAHYDSATRRDLKRQGLFSPGANDDASGVAAVVAAAYALSHFTWNHTIKCVAFSGEEIGLLGSRAYAHGAAVQQENIMLNLNADMIGYAPSAEDGNRLKMFGSANAGWAMDVIEEVNACFDCGFNFYRDDIPAIGEGWMADCHSFINYGYETVTFFEGGSYPYAHTPDDKLENINLSYLVKTTRLFTATLGYLADQGVEYPLVRIISPLRGHMYRDEKIIREFRYDSPWVMLLNNFYWKAASSYTPTWVTDGIWIRTMALPGTDALVSAEFYIDGRLEYIDTEPPFSWYLDKWSLRERTVTVVVYDEAGNRCEDSMTLRFSNRRGT